MTLGWAIITTGLHADVKIAPALNATPEAELVAVYRLMTKQGVIFQTLHNFAQ